MDEQRKECLGQIDALRQAQNSAADVAAKQSFRSIANGHERYQLERPKCNSKNPKIVSIPRLLVTL